MQLLIKEAKYQETFKLLFREPVSVGFKDGGCVAHSSLQQAAFVGGWKAARGRMLGDAMLVAMVRQRGFGLVRCTRCDGAQIRHPSLSLEADIVPYPTFHPPIVWVLRGV